MPLEALLFPSEEFDFALQLLDLPSQFENLLLKDAELLLFLHAVEPHRFNERFFLGASELRSLSPAPEGP